MGKKHSRQNRGTRAGGHERNTAPEPKKTQPTSVEDTVRSISEQVSHRKQRRFGHN
ncbi:hypothetical protein [Streptomyces sp. NPDC052042]|uniref:hypothetical protein n=1 Tax=Streptomyces sp. NPDC052042 TaxID=3365683 RepID=UPI0037D6EE43